VGIHACQFPVEPVRECAVEEQSGAEQMVVMDDGVAEEWTEDDASGGEQVGDCVDVLSVLGLSCGFPRLDFLVSGSSGVWLADG
jgi:hypothetical protein